MGQMTWTGAGEPAPGAGTVAGYGFFNTVLNYIFTQFNADDLIIAAATTTGAANQLVKTTAAGGIVATGPVSGTTGTFNGGISSTTGIFSGAVSATTGTFTGAVSATTGTFAGTVNAASASSTLPSGVFRGTTADPAQIILQVTNNAQNLSNFSVDNLGRGTFRAGVIAASASFNGTDPTLVQLNVRGAAAQSQVPFAVQTSAGGNLFFVDSTGIGVFTSSVTAPAFHGVADSALSINAGRVTAAGTLTLTFAALDYWNSSGQWINYGGGTYTYGAGGNLAVPGAGVFRYDLFYLDTSGTLTAVAGANGSDLPTAYANRPALVINGEPLGYLVMRPSTTLINQADSGVAGTGYVRDARNPFGTPFVTSGGGGGGSAITQNTGTVQVNSDGSVTIAPATTKHTTTAADIAFTGTAKVTMAQGAYVPASTPSHFAVTSGSNLTSSANNGSATAVGNRTAMWAMVDNVPDGSFGSADTVMLRLDQTLLTNAAGGTIAKTGILVNSYTPNDNGGDTSGILSIQTGGGNAITGYKLASLRPPGAADHSDSIQTAFEGGTDGGSGVFFAEPGNFFTPYTAGMTQTTFSASALTTDTTITVVATAAFPTSGWLRLYNAALTAYEDVAYTGKTSTTFTGVIRAFAGDTARAFAIGDIAFLIRPSQGFITRVENGVSGGMLVYTLNGQFDQNRIAYEVGQKNFNFTTTDHKWAVFMNGSMLVSNTGQATASPITAPNIGAAISVFDRTAGVGAGGMLQLGTGSDLTAYKPFATIKAYLTDGTANGLGDLIFGTRTLSSDTTTTERMRVRNGAGAGVSIGTNADVATVKSVITRTATSTFTAIASGAQQSQTLTGFTGLTLGDVAAASFIGALPAGCVAYASVASATTVTVTVYNISGGSVTPGGTVRVMVTQF